MLRTRVRHFWLAIVVPVWYRPVPLRTLCLILLFSVFSSAQAQTSPTLDAVVGAGLSVPPVKTITSGGLISLFGNNLSSTEASFAGSPLPIDLAGVCVQVGTQLAYLLLISPKQINAVAPALPASGNVPVKVIRGSFCRSGMGDTSAPINLTVAAQSPEFFYFVESSTGQNPVAAIDGATFANIGPPGLLKGVRFVPARPGEVLSVFATGLGATTPPQTPGIAATGAATVNGIVSVTIGDKPAQVLYAGVSPTYVGLYQINLVLPAGLAAGNHSIVIQVNGVSSPSGAYLTVSQ